MGYLNNPEATKESFTNDGKLRSGDVGSFDGQTDGRLASNGKRNPGFLKITGRIKEILITAGGENIAPVLIEQTIENTIPIVDKAVVIGDKRKFLSAILTLKHTDELVLEKEVLDFVSGLGSKATTAKEIGECNIVNKYMEDAFKTVI